jgi:hypothetical protein
MASWNEAYALCPFYDTDEKNIIICEAIIGRCSKTKQCFNLSAEKQKHLLNFCNKDYTRCPYYIALDEIKYKSN